MKRPSLIIFDFDGTLADTCKGILHTYHATISELGLDARTDDQLRATIGVPLAAGFRQLYPDFSHEELERVIAYYRKVYARDKDKVIPELFPGVVETLGQLRERGVRLSVASSRSTPSLKELCGILGIAPLFDLIIGADDTRRHKPDAEPVEYSLARLGYSADDAIVVGDMPVDIAMGRGAGCTTVGVTYGNSSREALEEAGATEIIDNFPELADIVSGAHHSCEAAAAVPDWAKGVNCAITVCDADCKILYMNDKACETFAKHGNLIGRNLLDCHNQRSCEIIARLLADGGTNCYTISKNGVRKMIYQSAWRVGGQVAGLVEISMVIPDEMPHYVRG